MEFAQINYPDDQVKTGGMGGVGLMDSIYTA